MHARTLALGRAAARQALIQAAAVLDAWFDEARVAICVVCLGMFVRPDHGRQAARVYCSDPCRQLAQRMRRPTRATRRRAGPLSLPFPDSDAAAGPA